jgi:hypothetical protein
MSGHFICDRCGYDGQHADYCVYLRPVKDQWKGHLTEAEMALKTRNVKDEDDNQ